MNKTQSKKMFRKIQRMAMFMFRTVLFVSSNLYCFVAYMGTMTLLCPLRLIAPSVYWTIEQEMMYWLESICISWILFGGYKVMECGDDIRCLCQQECLLLSNHQSTGDVPMIMLALHANKAPVTSIMWIIYKLYKWSHFGMVSQHRHDFFIDVGKAVRVKEMVRFKEHLAKWYVTLRRKWLIIFPEGGFLCRNQESSIKFARKNNLPDLKHVLLPRVGAVKAVFDTVGELYNPSDQVDGVDPCDTTNLKQNGNSALRVDANTDMNDESRPLKWIIDMTLAYQHKEPLEIAAMSLAYAPHNDVLIHWRAYRIKDIPHDEEGLTSWLYERYQEKEAMLEAYYNDGIIPGPTQDSVFRPLTPEYLCFDNLYFMLAHSVILCLAYLHYQCLMKPAVGFVANFFTSMF